MQLLERWQFHLIIIHNSTSENVSRCQAYLYFSILSHVSSRRQWGRLQTGAKSGRQKTHRRSNHRWSTKDSPTGEWYECAVSLPRAHFSDLASVRSRTGQRRAVLSAWQVARPLLVSNSKTIGIGKDCFTVTHFSELCILIRHMGQLPYSVSADCALKLFVVSFNFSLPCSIKNMRAN